MGHERDIALRLIEPSKPNQKAYIESFNGRLRDECLVEHWFQIVLHARTLIETWRWKNNEESPKKALGGLMPALYAKGMAEIRYLNPDSEQPCYRKWGTSFRPKAPMWRT